MVPTIRATPLKSPTRLLRWRASYSTASVPSSLSPPGPATSDSDASASLAPAASPTVMVCPLPLAMPLPPPRQWTPPSLLPDTLFSETRMSVRVLAWTASWDLQSDSRTHKTSIVPWRGNDLLQVSTKTCFLHSCCGSLCYYAKQHGRKLKIFRRNLWPPS